MSSKILTCSVLSALATAFLLDWYHKKFEVTTPPTKTSIRKPRKYDESLIREQLARNYSFLGEEGLDKIRNTFVVIVGCGGVGSNCIISLIRSGISHIRIVDFDQVSLSSLNRHAVAQLEDVGTPKVECLKKHILRIAPWVTVETHNELFDINNAQQLLLEGTPDYIVDCIDNIDTKVDLLSFCCERNLKVVSSMGAACKSDPTRINVGDISCTEEDSLARSVRRRLKKRGILKKIPVVFSSEKPAPGKASLLPLPDEEYEKGKVGELSALQNFRVRILPVLGTMPAMFGLALATYILCDIADYPMEPIVGKSRTKVDGIIQSLAGQQSRLGNTEQRIPIPNTDIIYIVEEIFRGKSPISNYSTRLTLSQWDPAKKLSLQNIVVMTKEEQKLHEQRVLKGGEKLESVYPPEVIQLVEKRFAEEKFYSQFR
ncbi:tRNA threonylcarbamoyladenosine dehydratase [Komagataella phaffii CBS 7435]|uniref:tRNA threonylcarbamoyladenosine dehydratase n=1 Tax=Komagataella phaffii (strain ATCC 76273 / CBS 7435 / CECT 11047 / NRRL Y-11430 / Wegner 21-1) TaxID=981350 RepID=F2QRF6_KOMPC|nr:GQ67_01055T0 [Komagataella phaffii]AOA66983.1 GQ68_00334T0 [Komagataella phaffii GS115]CAH2447813.1 tRNA threonylcarbamoyladenosine dehydratase [Komagataella phaffii CBS 7435]CCA37984.1 tRNA threonylcarbamoyladenosine dehydratase [Komagataella phaffii CBS 7435]